MPQIKAIITAITVALCFNLSLSQASDAALDVKDMLILSIEDLMGLEISTGTRTHEKSSLVPAVVTVITAEDIATFAYADVAEALSHSVGFVETDDLVMHSFGVRGIHAGLRAGNRTIKFMLNGQAVSFRSTSQNFIGPELIPMAMIERIEIVRGPVSALYGANALLGVVNIITRDSEHFKQQGQQLSLTAETLEAAGNGARASLAGGGKQGDFSYQLGAGLAHSDRTGLNLPQGSPLYHLFAEGTSGRQLSAKTDETRPLSLYGRLNWQAQANRQITLSGFYQKLDAHNSFSDLSPLRDSGSSRVALYNGFARLDWQEDWNETWQTRMFATWSQGSTTDNDHVEAGAPGYYLRRETAYQGGDLGAELIGQMSAADTLLIGMDYTDDRYDMEYFSQVDRASHHSKALNTPRMRNLHNYGFYAQWQHSFSQPWLQSQWHLTLGYRHDRHSYSNGQNSYRAGLVTELPGGKVLKFLVGSAFQAPSPELLFREAVQGGDIVGNPQLLPQQAETAEISLLWPLSSRMQLTSTLFATRIHDLVQYQSTQSNLFARNSTDSLSRGIELEARYVSGPWQIYGNALWQQTRIEDNPYNLFVLNEREEGSLFPEYSLNLGLSYFWRPYKLRLSFDNRYVARRPASTQNVQLAQRFYTISAYLDSTLTLSTQAFSLVAGKTGALRFQVRDLWDNAYVNPGFGGIDVPSLGRRYWLSFEQRF
ncbi:TonB-dependent receptor plug domain-containing protein [Candidatus Venteria ishoeyi]|uniref:Colicin I receptor n=1 Tax=Candidatus Venteria ishoeyi TaxID=1899563 RepID=A0A1H6F581_9GAMM|nr:TonB-dependent receptor [Candidatus Venteria ishoeyi]SEH04429.1 Colicin I receptor precursor [Candidatus Venteria ishoeyi]